MQDLITLHAARHVCAQHDTYCNSPETRQYNSTDECLDFLINQRAFGSPWELGQDTTGCRYMHTAMLKYRPLEHCPHVGPSGPYDLIVLSPTLNIRGQNVRRS